MRQETEFLLKIARELNLILAAREARATPQKQWRLLPIAAEKTAKISESLLMVSFYNEARTFFQENFWKEFLLRPASARKFWRNLRSKTENFSIPFKKKKRGRAKSKKSGEKFCFGSPVSFSKELDGGSGALAERKNGGGGIMKKNKKGKRAWPTRLIRARLNKYTSLWVFYQEFILEPGERIIPVESWSLRFRLNFWIAVAVIFRVACALDSVVVFTTKSQFLSDW